MEDINLFSLFIIELFFDNANIGKKFKKNIQTHKKIGRALSGPYLANKKQIIIMEVMRKEKLFQKDSGGS